MRVPARELPWSLDPGGLESLTYPHTPGFRLFGLLFVLEGAGIMPSGAGYPQHTTGSVFKKHNFHPLVKLAALAISHALAVLRPGRFLGGLARLRLDVLLGIKVCLMLRPLLNK
jgi:hypothetical protein